MKFFEKAEPCVHLGCMKNDNQTLQFCQALLGFGVSRRRAMTNLVMGLSAHEGAKCPVELSESEFFHYHYSNISKILEGMCDRLPADSSSKVLSAILTALLRPFFPPPRRLSIGTPFYAFTSDTTKLVKPHSPCLKGRGYVQTANNVIRGNRPLSVGYPLAVTHLGLGEAGWCPPLSMVMLEIEDDPTGVAVAQVKALMEAPELPFGAELCLERADSGFGKAAFLSPLYDLGNLVSIVRLRQSMRVWSPSDAASSKGAPPVYGEKHYLSAASGEKTYHRTDKKTGLKTAKTVYQRSIVDKKADDMAQNEVTLGNGRQASICLLRWNNLLLRSKKGHSMKKKPFDVVQVQVLDRATQKPIFDRPLFLDISGKRKGEVATQEAQQQYRERYDVEPYYRFAQRSLLLDKLQTPEHDHLQQWLRIVQISTWLLFVARNETEIDCQKWQRYLPKNQYAKENPEAPLTIAQTRKGIKNLFRTFDKTPFLPLKCKKGKGRKKGQTQPQRTRYLILRKQTKIIVRPSRI